MSIDHVVDVWQFPDLLVERYRCVAGPPEGVAPHIHDTYQLCLTAGVACEYRCRARRYVVPRQGMCVIPPHELHSTCDAEARPPGAIYRMLYVSASMLQTLATDLGGRTAGVPCFASPILEQPVLLARLGALFTAIEGAADPLEQDEACLAAFVHLLAVAGTPPPMRVPAMRAEVQAVRSAAPGRASGVPRVSSLPSIRSAIRRSRASSSSTTISRLDSLRVPRSARRQRPGFEWHGPIETAAEHLAAHTVEVELGPVERTGTKGAGRSVYFRDPDGSLLEFISYARS